ncbi:MAG: glycosyltransferase [Prochlorococcaceae cyanobacterium]
MKRVLVLNNYSFDSVWDEVRRGEKPDHHLYGINHFHKRGYEVEVAPFQLSNDRSLAVSLLQRSSPLPLGDLGQQVWTVKHLREGDILYAPCQTQAHLLCLARRFGLLRNPLICVAHHPFHRGRLASLRRPYINEVLRGCDWYPSLSTAVSHQIISAGGRSFPLAWGPDDQFYYSTGEVGHGVIAAGRTGRDFVTFAEGASRAGITAEIVCLVADADPLQGIPHIQLNVQPPHGYMNYVRLMELYNRARVLAIPLLPGASLSGLTSLMDALGMGKPVVCTRHPLIDLDIEKEGIGLWVDTGDVEGWSRALHFFDEHPEEARAMGLRGRALVEAGFNSLGFANQIMDLLDQVSCERY